MEREINLLSDNELDAVVGGVMETGTSYQNWQSDTNEDKGQWVPLSRPPLTVHHK